MFEDAIIRILSLVVTATIVASFEPDVVVNFTASFGLLHIFLGFVYSRRQIVEALTKRPWRAALLMPVLSSLFVFKVPLLSWFGLHHVFNELYLPVQRKAMPPSALFRVARVIFHLSCFAFIVRAHPIMFPMNEGWFPALLVGTAIVYASSLFRAKLALPIGQFNRILVIDAIALIPVAMSFYFEIILYHIALYHFVLWFFYPLSKMAKTSKIQLIRYLTLNLVIICAALEVSPLGGHSLFSWKAWKEIFAAITYIHITAAYAISDAHPRWIVQFFRPVIESPLVQPGQQTKAVFDREPVSV